MDYALAAKHKTKKIRTEPVVMAALAPSDLSGNLSIDRFTCKMSEEGMCLSSDTLKRIQNVAKAKPSLASAKTEARAASIQRLKDVAFYRAVIRLEMPRNNIDTYIEDATRFLVRIARMNGELIFADIVTGSLYESDGSCMSSSHLRVIDTPTPCWRKSVKEYLDALKDDDTEGEC